MEKIRLGINREQQNGSYGTLGMPYLLNVLKDSDFFDIYLHDEFIKTSRDMRGTTLFCNDKKVYLDFWEYPTPTYQVPVYEYGFDLVIKLQDKHVDIDKVHKYLSRKRMLPKSKEELQA